MYQQIQSGSHLIMDRGSVKRFTKIPGTSCRTGFYKRRQYGRSCESFKLGSAVIWKVFTFYNMEPSIFLLITLTHWLQKTQNHLGFPVLTSQRHSNIFHGDLYLFLFQITAVLNNGDNFSFICWDFLGFISDILLFTSFAAAML